jgi:hypothetical protein
VTAVGPSSATLAGKVNPNGATTSWYVEYGTSTSYGSKTANVGAGAGATTLDVSASLSKLAAGTTYHYRFVATNSAGTGHGADGIFTTSSPPGAVTGTAEVTPTSATLTGSVDPNGRATTWYFEYGTSTSYGSRTPDRSAGSGTSSAGVSAAVTNLAPGRVYHYRIVATSDGGTTRGADKAFKTTGAPTAGTGSASSIGPTTAKLNGVVIPNGRATTWYFEYGTSTAYGSRTGRKSAGPGTSPVNVSSSLTGLRVATVYHFRLVAQNDAGTAFGNDQTFGTSVPPVVATGAARDVGPTTATLIASVDPRGRSTSWYFEYGTTTAYGTRTPSRSAGSGTTSRELGMSISGLVPATTYHFRIVASSDAGTSRGADGTFTTTGVTLVSPTLQVAYGRSVLLSGLVPTRRGRESVTVYAQRYGEASFVAVATVLSSDDGTWRWLAQPRIQTAYRAGWGGGLSLVTVVGVRPAVSLRRLRDGRFTTRTAPFLAGRLVQLQRRTTAGKWRTVRRVRLGRRSAAVFRATLPRGVSHVRIALSVNQAGAGYLGSVSRTITVRRA